MHLGLLGAKSKATSMTRAIRAVSPEPDCVRALGIQCNLDVRQGVTPNLTVEQERGARPRTRPSSSAPSSRPLLPSVAFESAAIPNWSAALGRWEFPWAGPSALYVIIQILQGNSSPPHMLPRSFPNRPKFEIARLELSFPKMRFPQSRPHWPTDQLELRTMYIYRPYSTLINTTVTSS